MTDLLVAGGLLFTLPLTVLAAAVIGIAIRTAVSIRMGGANQAFWTRLLFHVGLFALVLGILSQAIGLYQMMSAIEAVGNVSPAIVMGGLKVSMIAPLFGLIILLAAMLLRFGLEFYARSAVSAAVQAPSGLES